MCLPVEADCDLDDGEAAEGEAFGVLPEVYLLHGCLRAGIEFQLH